MNVEMCNLLLVDCGERKCICMNETFFFHHIISCMKYCHVKVHGCGDTIDKHCLFFFPFFFSWEGAWVLYIMCIGAKLQYKPLYIHCKFILGITFFMLMQLHSNFTEDFKIK